MSTLNPKLFTLHPKTVLSNCPGSGETMLYIRIKNRNIFKFGKTNCTYACLYSSRSL